jgi:hypothetical protein
MESNTNLQIYRGSPTALAPLSVMDATSGTFSVALDPCAGLVALTMTPDGMTLMLQPVEDDGSLGVGVTLPTKGQISFFSVVAVHGGLAVGWTDEGSSAQQAHLAFVAVE